MNNSPASGGVDGRLTHMAVVPSAERSTSEAAAATIQRGRARDPGRTWASRFTSAVRFPARSLASASNTRSRTLRGARSLRSLE